MNFSHVLISKFAQSMLIDLDEISLRKHFLQLEEQDICLLKELNKRIKNKDKSYIVDFYSHLINFKVIQSLINNEYTRTRIKMGYIHQQVGLKPKRYVAAYNSFLSEVIHKLYSLFSKHYLLNIKTQQNYVSIIGNY